jgi:acyl-CoA thioester hydrolase
MSSGASSGKDAVDRIPFRSRGVYRHWTRIGMRWLDNDVYGHANNTIYYQWFDTAVNGWLIGEELLDIGSGDPIGLVVETGCRYARPLAYPGTIEIGLALAALGRSSVTYHLGVFAEDATDAAAEGHFTHVYVGRESRRPTAIPARWRARIESLAPHA